MADKIVLSETQDAPQEGVQDAVTETSREPRLYLLPELRIIIYRRLIEDYIAECGSTDYFNSNATKRIHAIWNEPKSRKVFWAPTISPVDTLSQEELEAEFYGTHSFSIMIWSGWYEEGGKDAFERMCSTLRPQMEKIKKFTFMTAGDYKCDAGYGKCGETMIGVLFDTDQPMSVHRRIGSDSTNWTNRREICKELADVAYDSLTHKMQAFQKVDFRILVDILCQLAQLGLCKNRQFGFIFQEELGCSDNRVEIKGLDPYTDYGPNNTEFGKIPDPENEYGAEGEDPENLYDHSANDPPDFFDRKDADHWVT
ncbi:hypothetical protein GGR57DRAFT_446702 [Xylariaceae sp. FL1272]|nr:hypothetical protein GGR57DRAFT_446702 [Xylariaceae sp. FL1272]